MLHIGGQPGFEFRPGRQRGPFRRRRVQAERVVVEPPPTLARQAEEKRLAQPRGGQRHAQADARPHLQPARVRNLVEIEDLRPLDDAEMDGIAGAAGQFLDVRAGDGDQRALLQRAHAERDQLRPQQIALVGNVMQIAVQRQAVEHPVGGAARRAQPGSDALHVADALRHAFQKGEATHQRLGPGRLRLFRSPLCIERICSDAGHNFPPALLPGIWHISFLPTL